MDYMTKNVSSLLLSRRLLIPIALSLLLVMTSRYSYVLFHTLAELFAILVALILSVVVWHTYSITRNNFLMYLGCGYFWVGSLDLFHTLAYKGMSVLPAYGTNQSAQFWISGRYLESLLLLSAPLFLSRPLSPNAVFLSFGGLTIAFVALIATGNFPDTFIEGQGLTPFKIYSEYVIIAILLAASIYFLKQREQFDKRILDLMVVSIILTIGAELAFTYYIDAYGLSNLIGHIFKIFSYWLIFEAIVHTALTEPYNFMSKSANTYEAIPFPTILINGMGIIHQANKAACDVANLPVSRLIDQHCHDLFHHTDVDVLECDICQAISKNIPMTATRLHTPKGNKYWEISLAPVDASNKLAGMVHIARNITKRVQIEESLHENEALFKIITETSPVGISISTVDTGTILFCNKQFGDILGVDSHELVGRKVLDFYFDSNDRTKLIDEFERTGRVSGREIETVTTSGINCWVLVSSERIDLNGEKVLLNTTLDISKNRANQEKMIQTAKLATIGEMAANIAHELNQPLSIVRMTAENILVGTEKSTYGPEKTMAKLNNLIDQVDRMSEIINHMRVFSRKDNAKHELFDPCVSVIDAIKMVDEQFKILSVDVSASLPDTCLHVMGHSLQMEQLIVNLLNNAKDATVDKLAKSKNLNPDYSPKIEIHVINKTEDQIVQVSVIDNGGGIPEHLLGEVADPFFTSKPGGEGTGLGLSISFDIVDRMNGSIELTNEGDGCRINILLPGVSSMTKPVASEDHTVDEEPIEHESASSVALAGSKKEIRILVADDERLAAESVSEYLEYKGFSVTLASNGEEALRLFLEHPIDAIVTDLRMPIMDGNELINNVRSLNQDIPIIVTTGHANIGDDDEEIVATGASIILRKPIELSKLAKLLTEMT